MKIGPVMHPLEFVIHARKFDEASPDEKRDMIRSWIEEKTFGNRITSEIHENYIDEGAIKVDGIINLLLNYAGYLVYDNAQEAVDDLYRHSLRELKDILLDEKHIIVLDEQSFYDIDKCATSIPIMSVHSYIKTFISIIKFGKIKGAFSFLWKEFPRIFITDNRVKEKHIYYINTYFSNANISRKDVLYK